MENNIFINSIRVVDEKKSDYSERDSVVDFYGEVIVQASNEEKVVIIEYTTDSWTRINNTTAIRLHTLSSKQDIYNFEISVFKKSNVPIFLEFRARYEFAAHIFWTDDYEFLYDEGTPTEKFFSNNTIIEDFTSQHNLAEEGLRQLEEERGYLVEESRQRQQEEEYEQRQQEEERRQRQEAAERRKLEEEHRRRQQEELEELRRKLEEENLRKQQEEERRRLEEDHLRRQQEDERKRRLQEEERRKLEDERNRKRQEEERKRLEEERRLLDEERRKLEEERKRQKDERKRQEDERKRQEDERKRLEEQRKRLEEERKKLEEERRLLEEERRLLEERRNQQENTNRNFSQENSINQTNMSQILTFNWCLNPNFGSGQVHLQGGK
ncbi:6406_t:CDS:1 [Dentiscutata erythropus]|uniref:6406_t:CDS:1 n=1 Tax=Dentiscutata erythropus TaxID=1348616 RepID=A0A9N9N995_9GLOM|nr:6406_t:CDS:1 [Dentiscutata erythropus]